MSAILIFLGDYVDRPPEGLEFGSIINILYLLSLKYSYPEQVYLLRGNHEAYDLMQFAPYEFPDELNNHFGQNSGERLHSMFQKIFSIFPIFIQLENGIFAAHGGIPIGVTNLSTIRPHDTTFILHTLWGDPKESSKNRGEISNESNFSKREFLSFLDGIDAKIMIRGHDYSTLGYLMYDNKLITVFTSERYKTRGAKGILVIKANPMKSINTVFDLELMEISNKRLKKRELQGY